MSSGRQVAQGVEESAQTLAKMPAGAVLRRMVRPLVRLLAEGRPVPPEAIAEAAGLRLEQVKRGLAGFADVEWGDRGRVVGLGLSLRPTEHEMDIDGRTLYAWCAFDTLLVAVLLERPVTIRSPDFGTGEQIRVETDGERIIAIQPPSAVVSIVGTGRSEGAAEIDAVRAASCVHGHFFASPRAAAGWLAEHPGGSILSVPEALAAGREFAVGILGAAAPIVNRTASNARASRTDDQAGNDPDNGPGPEGSLTR